VCCAEDEKEDNGTLLAKLLDDTHDPFSMRSPGEAAASFASLMETPRLQPAVSRPQRSGPSNLFSLKEVSNELTVSPCDGIVGWRFIHSVGCSRRRVWRVEAVL
jgi:hypothetical protein